MINIVTGKVNSGKTTRLISIYKKIGRGDGFINKKIYLDGFYAGQEIVRLSTNAREVFSLKKEFIPDQWEEECSYFDYSFSKNGLAFANKVIDDVIRQRSNPVFVDEIGPLEIYHDRGLLEVFVKVLAYRSELFVIVRDSCLEDFLSKFHIKKYQIIRVSEGQTLLD